MGLDVEKESQFLFEKSIRDEISSRLVDKNGNPTNNTRHLTSKHTFPQGCSYKIRDNTKILPKLKICLFLGF